MRLKRCLFSAWLIIMAAVAWAGTPQTWQGSIDGVPTWVTVVPRGHEISPELLEGDWWTWGNATTDAYLFAFDTPDDVRLILSFESSGDVPEASFYVREGGAARVIYRLEGDKLEVEGFPFYRLRPEQGDWLIGGKTNYDLVAWFDGVEGKVPAEPDGVVDYEERVGALEPGIPLWGYSEMVNDPHPGWGYPRYGVSYRMEGAPPFKIAAPLMPQFPYLGIGQRPSHWFVENPHPIFYRFDKEQLDLSSYNGFQIGGIYYANSISLPPNLSFETPFAFYNFVPESRLAQLVVRGSHTPPKDRYRGLLARGIPKTDFRYSWKTWNNNRWQYGLHVAGTHPYTDLIRIGDQEFYSVAPDELPSWIIDKAWPVVSFVEAVDGFHGSEGIYFYSAQARPVWPWLVGVDNVEPEFFATPFLQEGTVLGKSPDESIPTGFRGEYHASYKQVPKLYFSPVDNRVHLYGAQGGVWNLGGGRVLRSHNLFGSPYVNAWTREQVPEQMPEPVLEESQAEVDTLDPEAAAEAERFDVFLPKALTGDIEGALYTIGDYLVYFANGQDLIIREAPFDLAAFELVPPKDKASWQAHLAQLEPYRGLERDPFELRTWLDNYDGPSLTIGGVTVSEVHVSEDGLNFMLQIPDGAVLSNELGEIDTGALGAGAYSLRHSLANGSWRFEPAVAAPPEVSLAVEAETIYIDKPNSLELLVSNPGNVDLSGEAALMIGETRVESWSDLYVPGGEDVALGLSWIPFIATSERVTLTWGDKAFDLGEVVIAQRPRTASLELARLSFGGGLRAALLAFFVVATMGLLYRQVWR